MFDVTKLATDKATKEVLLLGGIFIATLIGIHYYKQIQLANKRIEKLD